MNFASCQRAFGEEGLELRLPRPETVMGMDLVGDDEPDIVTVARVTIARIPQPRDKKRSVGRHDALLAGSVARFVLLLRRSGGRSRLAASGRTSSRRRTGRTRRRAFGGSRAFGGHRFHGRGRSSGGSGTLLFDHTS